jgi:hypothetical protein
MKFLVSTFILAAALLLLMIAGLVGASAPATLMGFCSFAFFAFPLCWVAIYRFFSRHLSVQYRKG